MTGVCVSCDFEILPQDKFEIDNKLIVGGEIIHIVDPEHKNEQFVVDDEMKKAFVEN